MWLSSLREFPTIEDQEEGLYKLEIQVDILVPNLSISPQREDIGAPGEPHSAPAGWKGVLWLPNGLGPTGTRGIRVGHTSLHVGSDQAQVPGLGKVFLSG